MLMHQTCWIRWSCYRKRSLLFVGVSVIHEYLHFSSTLLLTAYHYLYFYFSVCWHVHGCFCLQWVGGLSWWKLNFIRCHSDIKTIFILFFHAFPESLPDVVTLCLMIRKSYSNTTMNSYKVQYSVGTMQLVTLVMLILPRQETKQLTHLTQKMQQKRHSSIYWRLSGL